MMRIPIRIKWLLFLFLLVAASQSGFAQAFNFSQLQFGQPLISPSLVSSTNVRSITFSQRNLAVGVGDGLTTSIINVTFPFVNKEKRLITDGLALYFIDDRTDADGLFKRQSLALQYGHNFRLNEFHNLSIGVQGSFNWNGIDADGLTTGSQFVINQGFDPLTDKGEDFSNLQKNFPSFAGGINWFMTDEELNQTAIFGFAAYDINQANNSFFDVDSITLPVVYQVFGGARIFRGRKLDLSADAYYQQFDNVNYINAGVKAGLIIRNENPFDPVSNGLISINPRYVHDYGFALGIQLEQESFDVAFSIDIPTSNQSVGAGLDNATEFLIRVKKRLSVPPKNKRLVYSTFASERSFEEFDTVEETVVQSDTVIIEREVPAPFFDFDLVFTFERNKSVVDPKYYPYLQQIAEYLIEYEDLSLEIVGHTDNTGDTELNLKLSYKRAKAIREYLVTELDLPKNRIKLSAKGDAEPLNENATEEEQARNRRVEFRIYRD